MSCEQNWWDDRTMPNDDGPDWHRDANGTLWQVDPADGSAVIAYRMDDTGNTPPTAAHLEARNQPDEETT